MKPRRVVSRISSVLMPWIQECLSTNWKPSPPRWNQNQRGRLTRNPAKPKRFAIHRTASSLRLKGGSISSAAPTSGV